MAVRKKSAVKKTAKKSPSVSSRSVKMVGRGPNFIDLNRESIARETVCCGGNDGGLSGGRKTAWLQERFREGFVFRKIDGHPKDFIEFSPSEKAWLPVEASGWLMIHCIFTTGSGRGKGYGRSLLESVVSEGTRQKKYGVLVVAAKKRLPLVPDARFFTKYGFEVLDEAPPHFVLLGLRLRPGGPDPRFREKARHPGWQRGRGLAFVYTDRCPLAEPCSAELEKTAEELNIPFRSVRLTGLREAKDFPCASSIAALFLDGRFMTHELLSGARLRNLLRKEGAI